MSAAEQIYTVLQASASPIESTRQPAEQQLKSWEIQPGFHSTLLDIASNGNLDTKMRLLAVITLKNGVDKYWRKSVREGRMSPEEKQLIRTSLLKTLQEPHDKIARYNSVIIAKIARIDFPSEWPDLLRALVECLEKTSGSQDPQQALLHLRALATLYQVIKSLCSKIIPQSRKIFREMSPELLRFMSDMFNRHSTELLSAANNTSTLNVQKAEAAGAIAVISLKTLRRVFIYGFENVHEFNEAVAVFHSNAVFLENFLHLHSALPESYTTLHKQVNTILNQIGKINLNLQSHNFPSFVQMPGSMDVVKFYWNLLESGSLPISDIMSEKLYIQSLRILKSVLKPAPSSYPTGGTLSTIPVLSATTATGPLALKDYIARELLTPSFVTKACEILIGRYMILSEEERTRWEEDPEEWVGDDESDPWEYNLRLCAEKVFMDLMSTNRAILQPVVMNMLQQASNIELAADLHTLLLKDAVYCAVGLAASDLYDFVDLEQWFRSNLLPEASKTDSSFTILHRRIAWLLAQWFPVKPTPSIRADAYKLLLLLMGSSYNIVVRLTAVSSMRVMIDDFEFDKNEFVPLFQELLDRLASVLNELDGVDSALSVVACLGVAVERMGDSLLPYTQDVMNLLPPLWEGSEGRNMLRASIMTILTTVTKTLRADSEGFNSFVVPIIAHSVDESQPAHVYLLEDGIDLWLAVVQNSQRISPELLSLMDYALKLLSFGGEQMTKILAIVEGYVILDPLLVLRIYAHPLFHQFAEMLGGLRPEASTAILNSIDIILQSCNLANCFDAIRDILFQTGLYTKLVTTVLQDSEVGMILVRYLAVIARIGICGAESLVVAMDSQLAPLVDVWCEKFDQMGHGKHRKLTAMALASLLSTGNPRVFERVQNIFPILSSVLIELKGLDSDQAIIYTYESPPDSDDEGSLDRARRQALSEQDPVVGVDLPQYVRGALASCQAVIGAQAFVQGIGEGGLGSLI
ncbi:armadillo-type protein [Phlyctochytrium arcticum]|nr:armadillo-type protein [Phlyctochytrium arcticum]